MICKNCGLPIVKGTYESVHHKTEYWHDSGRVSCAFANPIMVGVPDGNKLRTSTPDTLKYPYPTTVAEPKDDALKDEVLDFYSDTVKFYRTTWEQETQPTPTLPPVGGRRFRY